MSRDPKKRTLEENNDEYIANMHAIQSCIALMINYPETKMGDSKHMQVGIISSMVTHHAIATLMVEKGIFTQEEYSAQMVLSTRDELERMTAAANARIGKNINNLHFK